MKLLAALALVAGLSTPAFAGQPNLFSCTNDAEDIVVGYTSTSFAGQPTFNVTIHGQDVLNIAAGHDTVSLTQDQTSLGLLVTANVVRPFIADAPSLVYSVLIPGIQLGDSQRATFQTILIQGSNGGFMPLPAVYQRINKTVTLDCTAQMVAF